MKTIITKNSKETQKLGEDLAKKWPKQSVAVGPLLICLSGDLGSGKTTFTQGLLKGLGAEGPYTSPTFLIMKHYHVTRNPIKSLRSHGASTKHVAKSSKSFNVACLMFHDVYHIDAYRVSSKDILDLGWEEIISNPGNIVIIEWADRICDIIPCNAVRIKFKFIDENRREITFKLQEIN